VCTFCHRLRPPARAFRGWTTTRFRQLLQHFARHFPRPASQEIDGSATPTESVELRPVPVPRSAYVPVVEPQIAETQPLN